MFSVWWCLFFPESILHLLSEHQNKALHWIDQMLLGFNPICMHPHLLYYREILKPILIEEYALGYSPSQNSSHHQDYHMIYTPRYISKCFAFSSRGSLQKNSPLVPHCCLNHLLEPELSKRRILSRCFLGGDFIVESLGLLKKQGHKMYTFNFQVRHQFVIHIYIYIHISSGQLK